MKNAALKSVPIQKNEVTLDKKDPNSIREFVDKNYQIRYNIILERPEIFDETSNTWVTCDKDAQSGVLWDIWKVAGERIASANDIKTLVTRDNLKPINPYLDYFNSVRDLYDPESGEDHIQAFADRVPTDDPDFWNLSFKKWVVAAAKCATEDSFVNQHCLVLQGAQGTYKSTFVKKLLPEQLKRYYSHGAFDPSHPDGWLKLTRSFIINLDELNAMNKHSQEALKSLITKDDANGRELFNEHARDRDRYASFIGSVNDPEFLNDPTGSRRFIVTSIKEGQAIDIDYREDMSELIDKLWSQALHLAENGFETNYNQAEIKQISIRNRSYNHSSLYSEFIEDNYDIVSLEEYEEYKIAKRNNLVEAEGIRRVKKLKPSDIIKEMKAAGYPVTTSAKAVGNALSRLGFEKVRRSYLAYGKADGFSKIFGQNNQGEN